MAPYIDASEMLATLVSEGTSIARQSQHNSLQIESPHYHTWHLVSPEGGDRRGIEQ